jgi:pimeloyl-ACP methyl ester carboxylesterase
MIMKSNLKVLILIAVLLTLVVVQSCRKETDPYDDNEYLLTSVREVTLTKDNVVTLVNFAATQIPQVSEIVPDILSGVIVYAITYKTTFMGQEKTASGLVAIPSVTGTYPVLSYQNGTNTLHANAPSKNPYYPIYQLLECVASSGYVVVISDYLGFGASEDMVHPYLHKESTVQTVIDMLYAVKEFDEDVAKDITLSDDYFLMGYSQGGWATLALLEEMEKNYGSEFNVKAASCGAGPYDLNYFNSYILGLTEYPMPVFLAYIADAYSEYDLYSNSLTGLFNQPYASLIPGLFSGAYDTDQINNELTISISGLFNDDYISGYAASPAYKGVRDALAANSIEGWNSSVPILFMHGTADNYVIPELSSRMHGAMLDAGTNPLTCIYVTMSGLDHSEGVIPAGLGGLEFFKTYR